jgi:hypothetical protein
LIAHNSKETGEIFRISPRKSARGIRPLEKNNRITEYSAQIKSKSGFASEFDPQLTLQKLANKVFFS